MPDLHPGVGTLAPLLGSWAGTGTGTYPTIAAFGYTEEVSFGHTGKPFLTYSQRTRRDDGQPLHAETGYLRMPAEALIELVLAHPTGVTEIDEGTVTVDEGALLITVRSTAIGLTASAKEVAALERSIRVCDDELHYTVRMSAVGQPLVHHLAATLYRQ